MRLTAYLLPTVGLLAVVLAAPVGNSVSIAKRMALRGVGHINSEPLSIVDRDIPLVDVEASNPASISGRAAPIVDVEAPDPVSIAD